MDKNKDRERFEKEEENMSMVLKKEETYRGLALSSKKLSEISVKPKVQNGKVLFNKENKDHRYIVEEE